MWRRWLGAISVLGVLCGSALASDYAAVPGGAFRSVLPALDNSGAVTVAPFWMQRTPVTNAEFLAFVRTHPEWRRDRVPAAFADAAYLTQWHAPLELGDEVRPDQPVTRVSWFAAEAYCEAQGARLPTWNEWEFAAAADETRRDARFDPAWRQRILDWYARPASDALPAVAQGTPDVYGLYDLHGLIWEWVQDYNGLLVGGDSRDQGDPDVQKFCGAAALSLQDKENYAVLMRVALLSSLHGADTTRSLGFRCAKNGDTP